MEYNAPSPHLGYMYLINCLVNTYYLPMLLHPASGVAVARISCEKGHKTKRR